MTVSRRKLLLGLGAAAVGGIAACSTTARRPATAGGRRTPSATPTATPGAARPATPAPSTASTPRPATPARTVEIDHGPRTTTSVALTFHGQGDPQLTTALLDEVERAGAHVTVFAVGSWLAAHPELARRILGGGHELANHTYHHLPMGTMGEAEAFDETTRCAALLKRLTGSNGNWFRPSGTPHANPQVLAAAHRAGYRTVVGYDVDSLDWTDPGALAVRRNVSRGVRNGSIVSMHLGHPGTVQVLPDILSDLAARHLQPVTVGRLLGEHA
jgi:peptidoglycan/xylan/chitin deacetylase (PgdA/CDA1 family)